MHHQDEAAGMGLQIAAEELVDQPLAESHARDRIGAAGDGALASRGTAPIAGGNGNDLAAPFERPRNAWFIHG